MPHKYRYDRAACEGFFICITAAPDHWVESPDDPQIADLVDGVEKGGIWEREIDDAELDDAIAAAQGCPANVIQVVDEAGDVVAGPDNLPAEG